MRKILVSVITVLISIAFVTTGFAENNKAPVPPQDQSVNAAAPEKDKPAVKKPAKRKKKSTKKSKKTKAVKPAKKVEPVTPGTPATPAEK